MRISDDAIWDGRLLSGVHFGFPPLFARSNRPASELYRLADAAGTTLGKTVVERYSALQFGP